MNITLSMRYLVLSPNCFAMCVRLCEYKMDADNKSYSAHLSSSIRKDAYSPVLMTFKCTSIAWKSILSVCQCLCEFADVSPNLCHLAYRGLSFAMFLLFSILLSFAFF